MVLDDQGRSSFQRLQGRFGVENPSEKLQEQLPVTYYFFSVLYCDGYDVRRLPLIERKQLLQKLVVTNERTRILIIKLETVSNSSKRHQQRLEGR